MNLLYTRIHRDANHLHDKVLTSFILLLSSNENSLKSILCSQITLKIPIQISYVILESFISIYHYAFVISVYSITFAIQISL